MVNSLTKNGSLFLPENISNVLTQFDLLFYVIFWLSLVLLFGLLIFGFYFVLDGKRRNKNELARKQITHNIKLEIIWTVIPFFIVMIIFIWGFKEYMAMRTSPPNALEIYVRGYKWKWEFTYPNGKVILDRLVVPANRPVKLILTSSDVLHSFYLPNLRIKRDAIPNRYTILPFEANKLGQFHILCTEYCGQSHSKMLALLEVVAVDEYFAFLNEVDFDESIPLSESGKKLYSSKGCNACHSIDGSDGTGPTWKGLWMKKREFTDGTSAVANEEYIVESIYYPNRKIVKGYPAAMASYQTLLKDIEVKAIIEYIKEISK